MTLKLTCLSSVKGFAMDLIISYDSMCPGCMLCTWRVALKLNCLFSVEYSTMDMTIIHDSMCPGCIAMGEDDSETQLSALHQVLCHGPDH